MKKLKAFTLIELLVAMALSGIVVSSSYFVFSIAGRQAGAFQKATGQTMEVVFLKTLLHSDMSSYPFIRNISDYEAEFSGKDDRKVNYFFYEKFILRKQGEVTDTLHVSSGETLFLFEKNPPQKRGSLIDELTLQIRLPDSVYVMRFKKEYGPDVLMQEEETNKNY